ncbi:hypothetical protein JHK85_006831 [Glycine max]|nr:hypothetical protein JHK85_006831 [Glycine max]KAG5071426.1 hypothetical protein JHK86_006637 [Glycine max]
MSAGLQITGWPAHDSSISSILFGPDETSIFSLGSDGKATANISWRTEVQRLDKQTNRRQVLLKFAFFHDSRSNIFGSHDILGSWLPARYISNESVELKTHNDVIRFSLGKSDDINNAKKSQLNKKFKISRKAKLNELKCYRLKAKKKMNSPNPEAKRKETWLIEKLQKFDVPKPPPETYDPEILTKEERHYMKRTGQVHEYDEELARLSKGIVIDIKPNNTIIFYRGKNYVKPEVMSPPNTLSKAKKFEDYFGFMPRHIAANSNVGELLSHMPHNSPDELYLLFQQFCDHFHATSRNSMYMNFISSHSNNIHALEQLWSIKDKASSSAQVVLLVVSF